MWRTETWSPCQDTQHDTCPPKAHQERARSTRFSICKLARTVSTTRATRRQIHEDGAVLSVQAAVGVGWGHEAHPSSGSCRGSGIASSLKREEKGLSQVQRGVCQGNLFALLTPQLAHSCWNSRTETKRLRLVPRYF